MTKLPPTFALSLKRIIHKALTIVKKGPGLLKVIPPFQDLLNVSIGLLLWLYLVIPVIQVIVLPLTLLRLGVNQLARWVRPDLIPITNPLDHILSATPSCKYPQLNAAQVWKLGGKLEVGDFRRHFYEVFLSTEELRLKYRNLECYLVQWMFYCFKNPVGTINLKDRIREHKLKEGESLEKFVGEWMALNDYGRRPNWEILIIHRDINGNELIDDGQSRGSVLLFKIDHGLCDGYTFVHMVERLSGIKSPYIVSQDTTRIWTKMRHILSFPKVLGDLCVKLLLSHELLSKSSAPTDWIISFTTLNLEAIKKIRQKTKSHFNTVLGALQTGALRRFLLESGRVASASELPEYNWIGSPTGLPNHPAMTQGGMTNHLSVQAWQSPFRQEDPLKRLLEGEEDFLSYDKLSVHKSFKWLILPVVWVIPSSILAWGATKILSRLPISHGVSPLICSNEQYKLLGHRVDHLYLPVLVPTLVQPLQMYVVPVTNSGRLDLSINGSLEMFKCQESLDLFTKVYLKEELDKLVCLTKLELMED